MNIDENVVKIMKEIIFCPNIDQYYNKIHNPCYDIIDAQHEQNKNEFQIPEPFSGEIDKANILVISSNPAIDTGKTEKYPNYLWEESEILEFFYKRFQNYIKDGIRFRTKDGNYSNAVRFWAGIKARVNEIYKMKNLKPVPGKDYCLTEIVHCKSTMDEGVDKAEKCCSKHFTNIVKLSPASIFIIVGKHAEKLFCNQYNITKYDDKNIYSPVLIENKKRLLLFILAPSAVGPPKILNKWLNSSELNVLSDWVKQNIQNIH